MVFPVPDLNISPFQVQELEISEEKADRALREHGGNLMDTLVALTN